MSLLKNLLSGLEMKDIFVIIVQLEILQSNFFSIHPSGITSDISRSSGISMNRVLLKGNTKNLCK